MPPPDAERPGHTTRASSHNNLHGGETGDTRVAAQVVADATTGPIACSPSCSYRCPITLPDALAELVVV